MPFSGCSSKLSEMTSTANRLCAVCAKCIMMDVFQGRWHCCCYPRLYDFMDNELCPVTDSCCMFQPGDTGGTPQCFACWPIWCVKCPCRVVLCMLCCIGSALSGCAATACCTYRFKTFCDLGWTQTMTRYSAAYRDTHGQCGYVGCLQRYEFYYGTGPKSLASIYRTQTAQTSDQLLSDDFVSNQPSRQTESM